MRSKSWSPTKVDQPRSNHINQTFHIDHLTEEDKNQTVSKDQTLTKLSLLALRMIWSARVQRMRSMRTKASKKSNKIEAEGDQRNAKKLLWYRNICSRSHQKRYSWLISRTIYNHYKLFNERKQAEENYNQKNIGIKLKF